VQSIPISLLVDEVSLENNASSVTTSIQLRLLLSPGEERTVRVPLHIVPGNNGRLVIYLEARDALNLIVGRTARLVLHWQAEVGDKEVRLQILPARFEAA
jgi:hypothetical protein